MDGETLSARRRKHISRACNGCRRRRTKCDGRPRCGACVDCEDACVYEPDQDGRKPRTKQYIDSLESRLRILEAKLKQYEPEQRSADPVEEPVADKTSPVGQRGSLRVSDNGFVHYGAASLLMHEPGRPLHRSESTLARPKMTLRTIDWDSIAWDSMLPSGLLSVQLHKELLSIFFSYINDWCWWSDESDFLAGLVSSLSGERNHDYSALFHNMALALACHISHAHEPVAEACVKKAIELIETEGQQPLLLTAKGVMLIGTWQSTKRRYALGWCYAGMGVRTAQALGLHLDSQNLVGGGVVEMAVKEQRDRAFGTIFSQEQLWSMTLGHPAALLSDYIDTPLPAIDAQADARQWMDHISRLAGGTGTPSWVSTNFHHTCKLARIAERVHLGIYLKFDSDDTARRALVAKLHLELHTWSMQLPPPLRRSSITPFLPPHIINLHLAFQNILILLMRPTLTSPGSTDDPDRGRAQRTCSEAASQVLLLIRQLRSTPGLCMSSIAVSSAGFSAGTVYLIDAVQAAESSRARLLALQAVDECIEALQDVPWGMAHHASEILRNMKEEWCPPPLLSTPRDMQGAEQFGAGIESLESAVTDLERGGTFTDVHCSRDGREDLVIKLLSVDPSNYPDAPAEGIRRCLELTSGKSIPRGTKIPLDDVESIRMGTTVATNALLERQGERCALVTTKGFKDLMRIGKQSRPDIFDLTVTKLELLFDRSMEIDERVTLEAYVQDSDPEPIDVESDPDLVRGITGEVIRIYKRPDMHLVSQQLNELWDEGYRSLAIALLHSWTFPDHEAAVGKLAREKGFSVSVSHELLPTIRLLSRANSSVADAYLTPITRRYIESFAQGFEGGLEALSGKLLFMQSDAGLCHWDRFSGLRAILSGPAGGVIGYSKITYDPREGTPLIAVDMGGTSTDVSRYAGALEHVTETTTAQVILTAVSCDINTVAAGGGSRLFWQNNMLVVGPESAGAHPGPVSYGKGGHLAVTDANLLLGRLLPERFPKIFGPNEDESLNLPAVQAAFDKLALTINADRATSMTVEEIASGYLAVANEAMCRPIRTLTEARGYDVSTHNLVIFGGAGGQHGCSIASILGIRRIIVSKFSSILSAYGMSVADIVEEVQEPCALRISLPNIPLLFERQAALVQEATGRLQSQGFDDDLIRIESFFNCRYDGSSTTLMVPSCEDGDLKSAFVEMHRNMYGFTLSDRTVHVDDIRVRATGLTSARLPPSLYDELKEVTKTPVSSSASKPVYFSSGGWLDTAIFALSSMSPGQVARGPALLYDDTQTLLVEPGFSATALTNFVVIDLTEAPATTTISLDGWDTVQLSIYGHRFMAIAEQMGAILRQTCVSVNIKERLDYSCALFDPQGNLVANAPDMPGHLGAMSTSVRFQAEYWKGQVHEGDVFAANHPEAGGTHLPDITVITPAFHNGEIVFWTASRAHHADIGGISAGSMPANSTEIWQEGAQLTSFKLLKDGVFDEAGVIKIMYDDPAQYPGCFGTRTLRDNLSDLRAQVSANYRGIKLIKALCAQATTHVVQHFMYGIQHTAEMAVRDLLRRVGEKFDYQPLEAEDEMDDGSVIKLRISIERESGDATFDFTGTSEQVYGNLNHPKALVYAACLYTLRAMINVNIPLNHGCLLPIHIIVPKGSILWPSLDAATVAGPVETNQRVADVIFRCLKVCAASQGTANCFTFGFSEKGADGRVRGFGAFESVAGGSGGGASWDGQSATHVHMNNASIGDVESCERLYPVMIQEYSIRRGSGGAGRHPGGDGVIRAYRFTKEMDCAVLSNRRVIAPYGLFGGQPGMRGRNVWERTRDGKTARINLGSRNAIRVMPGDVVYICTPGGGGFGTPGTTEDEPDVLHYVLEKNVKPPTHGAGSVAQYHETQFGQ